MVAAIACLLARAERSGLSTTRSCWRGPSSAGTTATASPRARPAQSRCRTSSCCLQAGRVTVKQRPLAHSAGHRDRPLVRPHQLPRNRQPQPAATGAPARAPRRLARTGRRRRADSSAGMPWPVSRTAISTPPAMPALPGRLRRPRCVYRSALATRLLNTWSSRPASPCTVSRSARRLNPQIDPRDLGLPTEARLDVGQQIEDVDRLDAKGQFARLGQREHAQILDQAGELAGFGERRFDVRRGRLVNAVQHAFQVALDDVQRGPQLVRYVCGQVAAPPVGKLELGRHVVERSEPAAPRPPRPVSSTRTLRSPPATAVGCVHQVGQRDQQPPEARRMTAITSMGSMNVTSRASAQLHPGAGAPAPPTSPDHERQRGRPRQGRSVRRK